VQSCKEAACRLRLQDVYDKSTRRFGLAITGFVGWGSKGHTQSANFVSDGGGFGGGGPTDPGVQAGNRNTGAGLASLSTTDGSEQFFQNGLSRFEAVDLPIAQRSVWGRGSTRNSCVS